MRPQAVAPSSARPQRVTSPELSRRSFLTVIGAAAGGVLVPPATGTTTARGAVGFSGARPLVLAMHVHGSWSEGRGSWEVQFAQAAANRVDVLFMTDHDSRGTAHRYLTSLLGATWVSSDAGSLARRAASVNGGSLHLLAESSTYGPASVTLAVEPKPCAFNRLRTSIAGHSLSHTFGACSFSGGASYEVAVELSYHPQVGSRPAGAYRLVYRFGAAPPGRHKEAGGLVGVVDALAPTSGSTVTLTPAKDVKAIWPGMLAIDNCFYGLSFTAVSPGSGAVADVQVAGVTFTRSQSDPDSVIANQARVVTTYSPRHPGLAVRPSTEVSRNLPDMNPFGIPQFFSDYALDTPTNHDAFYRDLVADVHASGGVISWNHPFGYNEGPPLDPVASTAKRRQVFAALRAVGGYGVDLLEVGYALRGQVDTAAHLALWDTFSRAGTFLTGNGTSDDHSGSAWTALRNGFLTGAWASSTADADLVRALAGGRVYAAHPGRWPGGQLDLLVDDRVRMGSVSVSSQSSRKLAIWAGSLPPDARVELVAGPVDYTGALDPGASVLRSLLPTSFVGSLRAIWVDTTTSRFYRVQVRDAAGQIVGISNPVWLLRSPPPSGIPPARRS